MRSLISVFSIFAILALVAIVSKPTEAGVEQALKVRFLQDLAERNPRDSRSGGGFALTLLCKADRDACYDTLRRGLDVTYEDRVLYVHVALSGFNRKVVCYGAYTQFWCATSLAG